MKRLNWNLANKLLLALVTVAAIALGNTFTANAYSQQQSLAAPNSYTCRFYWIKRGDTLTKISNWYGVSIRAIMNANGLTSTRIYVGRRLCIPNNNVPPPPPPAGYGSWYGEYWNNTSQSGTPALVRNAPSVDFNWGYGSPDPALVFANYFSARWTRPVSFVGGIYRFTLIADDGIRLWVDGTIVFDRYGYVGTQTNQIDVSISPGVHTIRVDYVQQAGLAYVRANFYRLADSGPRPCTVYCPPQHQNGPWYTLFYNNVNLDGGPVFAANYNGINFDWRGGSPAPAVQATQWSARFVESRYLPAGVYRFVTRADDGVRIFVDDRPVVNQWMEQSARTITGDIAVSAGTHTIRVEYFQLAGLSELHLYWEFLGNPNP